MEPSQVVALLLAQLERPRAGELDFALGPLRTRPIGVTLRHVSECDLALDALPSLALGALLRSPLRASLYFRLEEGSLGVHGTVEALLGARSEGLPLRLEVCALWWEPREEHAAEALRGPPLLDAQRSA